MTGVAERACQRNCWLLGGASGAGLAMTLALLAQMSGGLAAVLGIITAVALGTFLVWAFCAGTAESAGLAGGIGDAGMPPQALGALPSTERIPLRDSVLPVPDPTVPDPSPRVPLKRAVADRRLRAPVTPPARGRRGARSAGLDAAVSKSRSAPKPGKPVTLDTPRGGKADDLKQIVGIGPVLERLLNDAGVWHFDQIAAWKARDIAYIDSRIPGFRGRITRDGWVAQARVLAEPAGRAADADDGAGG